MGFQHRAAAWLAVRVLAESDAASLWVLPTTATLEWLRCETAQPVDDLMIGTSVGGVALAQVKHTVQLSQAPSSDLGVALGQFVRQVRVSGAAPAGNQPWERPLDADRDRLVLIVGPSTSAAVRAHLPAVLERLRALSGRQALGQAASNARETRTLDVLLTHVRRSWKVEFGYGPSDDDLRAFLSLLQILALDVDSGGRDEREAKQLLSASVLRNPTEVEAAWALLLRACEGFAVGRSGANRPQLQRLCHEDPSRGVLQALVGSTLRGLAGGDPDRVSRLTKTVYDRVREGPGIREVREACVHIFAGLSVWRDHAPSRDIVAGIVTDPVNHTEEIRPVLGQLRDRLTHGPVAPPDPEQEAIRQRALGLVGRILEASRDALRGVEVGLGERPFDEWPVETRERWRSAARVADHVGDELYFASGAFRGGGQGEPAPTEAQRTRFYREAGWMLDELAELGLPSLAHHLAQTLETFVALDPRGVFLRLGRIVRAGRRFGYQYESMAADLIVGLVERYLAEFRALFREHEDCRRALLEILDVFVQAGWPSARRLTYRLEEIFR
jgi:hypothetical protein